MAAPPQPPQQAPPPLSPQQYLEQFLFVVAPVEERREGTVVATATGFFYRNDNHHFFVTNRHVVRHERTNHFPDTLRLRLHTNPSDPTQNSYYDVSLYDNGTSTWREKPNVDVAAVEIPAQDMERFVIKALSSQLLPPRDLVIAPGEDVIITGYPRGFYDTLHNYPISRIGAVASAYRVDFAGRPFFLIDAHLHPGTSGSPVLTKPSTMWRTSEGTSVGGMTTFFLGINSGEIDFGPERSGLNAIWYAREVEEITAPRFQSQTFPQQ